MPDYPKVIKKLQELPEGKRKIIAFSITGLVALVFLVWFFSHVSNVFKSFEKERFLKQIEWEEIKKKSEEGVKEIQKVNDSAKESVESIDEEELTPEDLELIKEFEEE